MEWLLMAALAFVVGGLIGVKFGRQRIDLRQKKSALEWEKGKKKNKKPDEKGICVPLP
jgi:hypothetical protein